MAYSNAWKDLERRVAAWVPGGNRIIRENWSDVEPDGESDTDVWECKYRSTIWACTTFRDEERKRKEWADGRRFWMVFKDRGARGDFVMIRDKDFAELLRKEKQLEGLCNQR
jgi:hypothetical protein